MSITAMTEYITATITQALPEVVVCTDSTRIRPALAASKTVAWVGAPKRIHLDAQSVGVAEYEIALISPEHAHHLDGLARLAALARRLAPLLAFTELEPDTVSFGQGQAFPALFLSFELPYTLED